MGVEISYDHRVAPGWEITEEAGVLRVRSGVIRCPVDVDKRGRLSVSQGNGADVDPLVGRLDGEVGVRGVQSDPGQDASPGFHVRLTLLWVD